MRLRPMSLSYLPLAFVALLGACSEQDATTAPTGQPSFVPAPSGDPTLNPVLGTVKVCAFFPGQPPVHSADFTATVNGTPTNFTLANNTGIDCQTVWMGTEATPVTVALNSATQGLARLRTWYYVNPPADEDFLGAAAAAAALPITRTGSGGQGIAFWFKIEGDVPPETGVEGCTPGYWKQAQHFDSWPNPPYAQSTLFQDVFGPSALDGKTLLQVLGLNGAGISALGRHSVAALLNAESADVDYGYETAQEVIDAFHEALESGAIEHQKNIFDGANNGVGGCPLN